MKQGWWTEVVVNEYVETTLYQTFCGNKKQLKLLHVYNDLAHFNSIILMQFPLDRTKNIKLPWRVLSVIFCFFELFVVALFSFIRRYIDTGSSR